jgi:hypothetical protein
VPRVRKRCKEKVALKKSKKPRKSKNSKNENPPNVLKALPIENFRGCLCQKRRLESNSAETLKQNVKGVTAKLKKIALHGVLAD